MLVPLRPPGHRFEPSAAGAAFVCRII